jgi:hypothetical protein
MQGKQSESRSPFIDKSRSSWRDLNGSPFKGFEPMYPGPEPGILDHYQLKPFSTLPHFSCQKGFSQKQTILRYTEGVFDQTLYFCPKEGQKSKSNGD